MLDTNSHTEPEVELTEYEKIMEALQEHLHAHVNMAKDMQANTLLEVAAVYEVLSRPTRVQWLFSSRDSQAFEHVADCIEYIQLEGHAFQDKLMLLESQLNTKH